MTFAEHDQRGKAPISVQIVTGENRRFRSLRGFERNGDISPVDEGSRYNLPNVTNFSNWPEWLKVLVLVPHGILASVACWLWWPKSEKGWRRFGFVVAYLLVFLLVMRYVFQMKDFK